jgi:hypothetical protein
MFRLGEGMPSPRTPSQKQSSESRVPPPRSESGCQTPPGLNHA